jgi:hypothetical protein
VRRVGAAFPASTGFRRRMNWFLNTDRNLFPAACGDCVAFIGDGDNIVFIDCQHETSSRCPRSTMLRKRSSSRCSRRRSPILQLRSNSRFNWTSRDLRLLVT